MSDFQDRQAQRPPTSNLLERLRQRGVLRVAFSYAVIGWLLLQIGDVVLEPLNAPAWTMRAMIILVVAGFPIALALAWYFEFGPGGVTVDRLPEQADRPATPGIRRYADGVVIAVLLAIIVLLLARQGGLLETDSGPPVLGVLPFTEIGNPNETYFGDGLSDTLIHKLGQVSGLVVLASTSSFEFRDPAVNLAEVARKLGASVLLTGSVQRAQGQIRVNARLVDPQSGQQRWTASFDRGITDVFAVQDEIAESVTASLKLVLAPTEEARLTQHQTNDLTAYDAYLKGREGIAARTSDSLDAAVRHLQEATALDPDFALAHAALTEAYFLAYTYSFANWTWQAAAREAHASAARAQALDPGLGEAWLAQAMAAMGDNDSDYADEPWDRSYIRSLLAKAVELSPNNAIAWKFYAAYTDDPDAVLAYMQRAARLDPRSGIVLMNLGGIYHDRGDVDRARQLFRASLDTAEPIFEMGLFSLMGTYLGNVSDMALAARWGRYGHLQAPHDFGALQREYCLVLLQLGAWEELDTVLKAAESDPKTQRGAARLYRLGLRTRYLRILGDPGATASAQAFLDAINDTLQERAANLDPDSPPASVLATLVLQKLRDRDPAGAVDLIDTLSPELPRIAPLPQMGEGINLRILRAVAQKQAGDTEAAETALRQYLDAIEAFPVAGPEGTGFLAFSLHAFLGETEAAVAAIERVVKAGNVVGWWGLKEGVVDPDYARVWADPRVQQSLRSIEASVAEQRAAFRADPEVPLDELVIAGLVSPPTP